MGSRQLSTPDTINNRYKRRVMREKRCDAARSLMMFADQFVEEDEINKNNEMECVESGTGCQTDLGHSAIQGMQEELQNLRTENLELKEKAKGSNPYSVDAFQENDERVLYFTGLPCFMTLMTLFNYLESFLPEKLCLDKFECLTMTMSKLRLNFAVKYLSFQLGISKSTISRIFLDTIDVMYTRMKPFVMWPDRESLRKTMPVQFQERFGQKCAVIIDCFEVFIERPSNLKARAETWSSYKHHNTVKFLIGITPQGAISFLSKSWGGRTSDRHITENCGFLDFIMPGDMVLADRGFDISDIVGSLCGGQVQIPAFTKGREQLSPLDVETTRKLASVRIHVERVIGLVRQKYTILSNTLPLDYLITKDSDGVPTIDKIARVCCSLVNLCDTVVVFD